MKKIIFSDIDKTLCQKKEISEVTKKTINDYINSGGIFVLVSGRGVKYTKMIANQLSGIRYIICNNGAIGYDIETDKAIYSLPIDENTYNKLCTFGDDCDCSFIINTTTDMYAKGYYTKDDIYTKIENIYSNMYDKKDVMQLVLSCTEKEDTKKLIEKVEKVNNIKIINRHRSLYDDSYPEKNNVWIDITNTLVNKGYGVIKILEYLNFKLEDSVRMGDDLNDIPMFFDKGVNVAVDNAIYELKEKADIIAPACTLDGAASVIRDIIDEKILKK